MKKIVLAGGSGFLGRKLSEHFHQKGFQVIILSRSEHTSKYATSVLWDGESPGDWCKSLEGSTAIINLAGKSVDCRYTKKNQTLLINSRVKSTKVLGDAINRCSKPPEVWINSSTATIYENTYGRPHTESDHRLYPCPDVKDSFSFKIATLWENEFNKFNNPQIRKIIIRTSLVFDKEPGTVYCILRRLAKLGLGGKMGHGQQFVSWIHINDFIRSIEWLIDSPSASGIYNMAAPTPLSNQSMMQAIRAATKAPFGLPATKLMLEIGAFFMGTETELILKSRNVYPERLIEEGFKFEFAEFTAMIKDLEQTRPSP